MIIEKSEVKIDTDYNYNFEIDPIAEEWLLRKDKNIITNFKDNQLVVNFYQFDEKEVVVDGIQMKVPDKGIYMRYEPWAEGQVVYRIVKLSGISKKYNDTNASIGEQQYGAWVMNRSEGREIQEVFNSMINAIKSCL